MVEIIKLGFIPFRNERTSGQAGFQNFEIYSCWPDYRMPDYITPHGVKSQFFRPINPRKKGKLKFKRLVANRIEWVLFKLFNLQFFAPSMIIIAK